MWKLGQDCVTIESDNLWGVRSCTDLSIAATICEKIISQPLPGIWIILRYLILKKMDVNSRTGNEKYMFISFVDVLFN